MSAITFMYAVPARDASKLPSRLYRKLIVNLGSQQGRRNERTRDMTRLPAAIRDSGWSNIEVGTDLPMPVASVRAAEGASTRHRETDLHT